MLIIYVIVLVILTPAYGATSAPPIDPGAALAVLTAGLVASGLIVYTQLRFGSNGSLLSGELAAGGSLLGDVTDAVRPSDREERSARRRMKRGAITRREYELLIARRHFVHGEISHAEYSEIVRQLSDQNVDSRRGARPPPDQR
jgi:hypothetical protein